MIFRRGIDSTRGIGWVVLGPGIARAYLGPLNGMRRQPSAIFGHKYVRQQNPSNTPRNVNPPPKNHNAPPHIINSVINSYYPTQTYVLLFRHA